WSSRGWKAQTTEQVPDQRITWTSEGAKGTTKGAVTFHSLADDLTRVLLVIEYYPQGFFEKTGNIWRAQGRRARLDLKNFARFITLKGEAEDGWRGEIRDGEVAVSHEDAVAEEEREDEEQEEQPEDEASEDGEAEGEYEEDEDADEAESDEEPRDADEADEDEDADEDEEAEGYVDEDEEGDLEDPDEVPEGEDEDVPEAEDDAEEDIDEEPYEDEDEERAATAGGSRR
ncbi:SRPBCC family protein, partial [Streptomyces caniscabiei]